MDQITARAYTQIPVGYVQVYGPDSPTQIPVRYVYGPDNS